MDQDQKHLLIPLVAMVVAIILWSIIILLFVVDGEEIGSVAEWVGALGGFLIGTLAAYFAYRAWEESKRANTAEQLNRELAEISIASQVNFDLVAMERSVPMLGTMELKLTEGSPKVWIDSVELSDFMISPAAEDDKRNDRFVAVLDAFNVALDQFAGEVVTVGAPGRATWRFGDALRGGPFVEDIVVRVQVHYRIHGGEHATRHTSPRVDLDLTDISRPSEFR